MARSAKEATLFTSTGPYASSKSPGSGGRISQINLGPAPENETPLEKVARLRAAAQRVRQGQQSPWDRVVLRGRRVADTAHKITTYSLIGFSGLAGIFIAFSTFDYMLYKRRKRKEWAEIWREQRATDLAAAQQAIANRTASEEQVAIVEQEREKAEAAKRKKNRKWTDFLFSNLSKEETPGGMVATSMKTSMDETPAGQMGTAVLQQEPDAPVGVMKAVESLKEEKSKHQARQGQLDQMAENATQATKDGVSGWMSWIGGR